MINDTNKALIYCRVSSPRQIKEGHGLENQEHRCRQYAVEKKLKVVEVFSEDESASGGLFDRPAMKELLNFLDRNQSERYFVIFDDLKRFARDVEVHFRLKTELVKLRAVKLRCLNFNFDDSPEGRFVETMFAACAQLEREQNKRQVIQKQKARLENGYWTFYPPAGYEYKKSRVHGKLLYQVHPLAETLGKVIEDFATNRLIGKVDVVRRLVELGILKESAPETTNFNFVRRLLSNPIYAGFIEYKPWQVPIRKGHHKAVITEEVHRLALNKMEKPERMPRNTDSLEWPLRRLVDCSICGKQYTGSANRSKNPDKHYPHYTCNNKYCTASPKNITKEIVEEKFLKLLKSIGADKPVLDLARAMILQMWKEKEKNFNTKKSNGLKRIGQIDVEIESFLSRIPKAKSESLVALYESKIDKLENEKKEIEKSLKNKKEPNLNEAIDLVLNFLGTPAEFWKYADLERKILIHSLIFIKNPEFSLETGFGTPNLSLPFYIKHYVMDQDDTLVEVEGVAPSSKRLKTAYCSKLSSG